MNKSGLLMDSVLVTMFASGFFNFAFSGTPLQAWKQFIICIALVVALVSVSRNNKFLLDVCIMVFALTILVLLSSIIAGASFSTIFRSIFSYIAWLPFLIFGALGWFNKIATYRLVIYLVLLIGGAIGLYVDLNSGYFDFLKTEVIDFGYYLNFGEAKRAEFVFVASTLALPVMAGFYVIVARNWGESKFLVLGLCSLIVASFSTGSFSGVLIAITMIGVTVFGLGKKLSLFTILLGGFLVFFVITSFFAYSDMATIQIERILANQSDSSDANYERIGAWLSAFDVISGFDFIEHIGGAGLGSGDIRYAMEAGALPYLGHGESSFLQAYIEGGLAGLLLRVFPFVIFVRFYMSRVYISSDVYVFAFVGITFVAVMLAPTFGNIPYQILLGLLIGGIAGGASSLKLKGSLT